VNPFGGRIEVRPYDFDEPRKLVDSLRGAAVLYNTYWIRFPDPESGYSVAVENTLKLFDAAKEAGVRRVVHVSIANPSEDSPFPYFREKARLERALKESGLAYAILRPAVLFGPEGILINNIAWLLRKSPVFGVFGSGKYRLRPILVDDLAKLAVEQGRKTENCTIDAVGPETFTYRGLVEEIARAIGPRRPIVPVPASFGLLFSWFVGKILNDVMLTRDEIKALMAGLLCTDAPPAGETKLTDWLRENSVNLGARYSSELARRRNRKKAYMNL
jgi:NADH dehydrogenase